MRRLLFVLLFAAVLPVHATTTYLVESRHTQGVIRWNHLGFSNPTAHFTRVEGTLLFDPGDPAKSSVSVTIPMAAMSSGVPDLDEDFRSAAFFDYAKFPQATFKSRKVEKEAVEHHYRITGDLTLHGTTRPVVLEATLNKVGTNVRNDVPAIGFEATATLKRSDFGVGRFVPQVSDEVEIRITFEANEATALVAYLRRQAVSADNASDRKDYEQAATEAVAQAAAAERGG